MGIQLDVAARINALALSRPFSVCELGAQGLSIVGRRNASPRAWWSELGCGRYESIDGNGESTFTHDLNTPLPYALDGSTVVRKWADRFDLVTDFGTGEHIFDQAQVWRTLHDLVKPGGYIVFDRPTTDYYKHCFYLVNECLVRDLAAANDYDVVWLERQAMARGNLIRGAFRAPAAKQPFRIPQQGRYHKDLVIPS